MIWSVQTLNMICCHQVSNIWEDTKFTKKYNHPALKVMENLYNKKIVSIYLLDFEKGDF